ncbi:unnamed protein product [Rhizophagus irregularis]|nr:unnamed protein product [Rhizophagus irregularis]
MEGREKCQVLGNLHKNNQDNNASSIQYTSDEQSQQQKQKGYLVNGEADKEDIHPETNELTGDCQKDQDKIEEVIESLTNEESINEFLARQRLRFVKGKSNDQETKNSMFLEMHIAAHNIDGITSVPSIQKLHNLLDFIKENGIDIMAISETNIDYQQEYFINQDIKSKVYSIIFSERDQKTKGSGTALVIHNKWMKHYYSVVRISPYILVVKFLFIQREIWVWSIYATPNNQNMRKNLIEELKIAMEGHDRSVHNTVILHVVLGDFNDTINNKIDRSPSTGQPGSQFLIQLSQLGLYDVCRILYPDAELFTHEKWDKNKSKSGPISKSRIDQIWITHEPDVIPVEFSVHSSQMITNSHHSIISTTLNISGFIRNNFRHCVPDQLQDPDLEDKHQNKHIVDFSKITNMQWENFTETLDREIEAWDFQQLIDGFNYEIQLGDEKDTDGEEIKRRFNELWDNVMSAISIAMSIELPMKVVKYLGSRNIRHKLSFADKTMRHTTKLESLIRKICKDQDFLIAKDAHWVDYWLNRFNKYNDDYRRKEYDKFIDKYEELIIPTHDLFSDTWINNVKGVVKQRIKIDKNYLQAQRLSKIQESIEKRCNIIHSDIPKWLLSTQDVVKEHIIIDRAVISNKNESVRLAIDPDTIRTHAKDTFAGILRKRNTKSIEQDVFWSNIYRPKGEFTECMANLMDEIMLEEWQRTLELVNTNSAPGPSGIGYAIIKHISDKSSTIILKIINLSLKLGVVPDQWKQSLIHPIPKPQKFDYILANTRPIALLDNIRKSVTKLLTNRLSTILTNNKVLRRLNFCGLKGEDTAIPLRLINDIIEDAREKGRELWVVTQDMMKAYDSVSLESLQIALRRLDIPEKFILWIIGLFKNRQMSVITAFGPSPTFIGGDGIDQGDTISPLLWRIFYDPLLVAIQQACNQQQGYEMVNTWPSDIQDRSTWQQYRLRVPVIAYMDDTSYLDSSGDKIQASINIATQFYHFHDVDINGKKSELIVINPKLPRDELYITIGRDNSKVQATDKEIRYLGCYFSSSNSRKRLELRTGQPNSGNLT